MNLEEIRGLVYLNLSNRQLDTTKIPQILVDEIINKMRIKLFKKTARLRKEYTYTLTSSDISGYIATIAFSSFVGSSATSSIRLPIALRVKNYPGVEVDYSTLKNIEWEYNNNNTATQSVSSGSIVYDYYWCYYDNNIYIVSADLLASYEINLLTINKPNELSDDSDTTDLPVDDDLTLVSMAVDRMLKVLGKPDRNQDYIARKDIEESEIDSIRESGRKGLILKVQDYI